MIGGVSCKLHFFCMDLPQSDAPFVKAYPAETTEAFLDGHVSAFAFFGGVGRARQVPNTAGDADQVIGPAAQFLADVVDDKMRASR